MRGISRVNPYHVLCVHSNTFFNGRKTATAESLFSLLQKRLDLNREYAASCALFEIMDNNFGEEEREREREREREVEGLREYIFRLSRRVEGQLRYKRNEMEQWK